MWNGEYLVRSLWVTTTGQASKGDTAVGLCYIPSNQGEKVELRKSLYRRAIVLVGELP